MSEERESGIDVSPTIEPDLRPDNFVTRAPASMKLLDFFVNDDGFSLDLRLMLDNFAGLLFVVSSVSSSVDALRKEGGNNPRESGDVVGEEPAT